MNSTSNNISNYTKTYEYLHLVIHIYIYIYIYLHVFCQWTFVKGQLWSTRIANCILRLLKVFMYSSPQGHIITINPSYIWLESYHLINHLINYSSGLTIIETTASSRTRIWSPMQSTSINPSSSYLHPSVHDEEY